MTVDCPLTTIVHVSRSFVENAFGTRTRNMPVLRPGSKCVGWPMSGPPGSMRLFGPIGTSIARDMLRLR